MDESVVVEEKDKKELVKKILLIVGNVVFYAVVIALFLFSLMNINAGNGTENFPNIFGKGMLSVETNSMERTGDNTIAEWDNYTIGEIKTGDLLYVDVFNGDISTLKVGDVITFAGKADNYKALITHRIVFINGTVVYTEGDLPISQGKGYPQTLEQCMAMSGGDKVDGNADYIVQSVNASMIRGVVTGVKSGAGSVLSNIRENWLFYFVIPVAIVLLFEVFLVVKNILDLRAEKSKAALADDKEAMMAELEAEKEKMRQELLAELRKQQQAEAAAADEKKEEVKEINEVEESTLDKNTEE